MNLGLRQKLIVRNFGQILIVFLTKNKENDKDISMEVLYNYLENLNKNNFDDGNIDIDIDVNNLQRWIIYLILLIRLRK